MRIRNEVKVLERQLKFSSAQQGAGDVKELDDLKRKLQSLYAMQGFKDLVKRKDLFSIDDAKVAGSKPDTLDLQKLIKPAAKEETDTLSLVVDTSKADIGKLIKLNSLQKRVSFIQHVLGDWKPTPRYNTLTEEIEQVKRFLDLLDS